MLGRVIALRVLPVVLALGLAAAALAVVARAPSALANVGDGPLVFDAHRPGLEADTMVADQVIERDGAPKEVVPGVDRVRYAVSPDHRHWHLLGFDRYELRRAGRMAAVVRDRKTGFCLG